MKTIVVILIIVHFSLNDVFSQPGGTRAGYYRVGARYTQEFILGGYVRVREWELAGDKMALKDLGMTNYPALQFHIRRDLGNKHSVSLIYDQYLMRGATTFDRDIAYNGTLINGRTGIDVSPTRYYRISAFYRGVLLKRGNVGLNYTGGLVFDHIVFYLDGEVSAASSRSEVYEAFGRQAFPYPVAGLSGAYNAGRSGTIHVDVSGTYIPKFKSFYAEGGNVSLQYSNFDLDLKYSRRVGDFEMAAGGKLRHMKLFQESQEDTNEIRTFTAGPYLEVTYNF